MGSAEEAKITVAGLACSPRPASPIASEIKYLARQTIGLPSWSISYMLISVELSPDQLVLWRVRENPSI